MIVSNSPVPSTRTGLHTGTPAPGRSRSWSRSSFRHAAALRGDSDHRPADLWAGRRPFRPGDERRPAVHGLRSRRHHLSLRPQTDTTIRIAPAADGFSYSGQTISADGRYVVFQGTDGNQSLVYIYNNDPSDAAHYQQTIQLVAGGAPAVSGDGSRIVVEHGGNSIGIYDQQGHVIGTITAAAIGETGTVWLPAISADGHLIAFWQTDAATPGGSGHLFVYDLSTGTATAIASTATDAGNSAASFSADGRYVVYQSDAPGGHSEIYLYDLSTGEVVFHTANASGASYNPVISPDGNYIIFASDADWRATAMPSPIPMSSTSAIPANPVYTPGFEPRRRQPARRQRQSGRDHQRRRQIRRVRDQRLEFFERSRWRRRRYLHQRPEFGPQRHHLPNRHLALVSACGRCYRADRDFQRPQRDHARGQGCARQPDLVVHRGLQRRRGMSSRISNEARADAPIASLLYGQDFSRRDSRRPDRGWQYHHNAGHRHRSQRHSADRYRGRCRAGRRAHNSYPGHRRHLLYHLRGNAAQRCRRYRYAAVVALHHRCLDPQRRRLAA